MNGFTVFLWMSVLPAAAWAGEPKGDRVAVDFAESKPTGAGEEKLMEAVATGIGTDPDQARQNAFCNAIEQVVGVLVDAETLVKNDEIVYDQVLTFSRGEAQQYTVLRQWQQDGLHYVRIRAKVAVSELGEKLTANKIAVHEVPGELLYRQAKFDLLNEQQAAEMFRKTMRDYGMDTLIQVEIVGKPEIVERNAAQAKLQIKVRLSSDQEKWNTIYHSLEPFFSKVASKQSTFSTQTAKPNRSGYYPFATEFDEQQRLRGLFGRSPTVLLFERMTATSTKTYWNVFQVPEPVAAEVADFSSREYRLLIALLDADGHRIKQFDRSINELNRQNWMSVGTTIEIRGYGSFVQRNSYAICPFLFANTTTSGLAYAPTYVFEETVAIELEKLQDVAEVAAFIEEGGRSK